jgi:hypothetical protein
MKLTIGELRKIIRTEIKNTKLNKHTINEVDKMSMSYKLKNDDKRNIEVLWHKLSKDKSKSHADIIDTISSKLQINWFEISSWVKRNLK